MSSLGVARGMFYCSYFMQHERLTPCRNTRRAVAPMRRKPLSTSLVFLLVLFLLCCPGATPLWGQTNQSTTGQANELLRRKIEAWKTPLPVLIAVPICKDPIAALLQADPSTPKADDENICQATVAPAFTTAQPKKPSKLAQQKLMVGADVLRTVVMLARFYEGRGYQLAWSTDSGPLPHATALLDAIQAQAEQEGLQAKNYRLEKMQNLVQDLSDKGKTQAPLDPRALMDLDLLLTDTFLLYGAHVSLGTPRWTALDAQWFLDHQKTDLVLALQHALATNRVADTLKELPPWHSGYTKLRDVLAKYRELRARGGWPHVPPGFDLRPGDQDDRIPALRARLQITGELTPSPSPDNAPSNGSTNRKKERNLHLLYRNIYDPPLVQAVKRFQKRHGLAVDGVVGGRTLATLNVSITTRIRQIIANMNRWRELPNNLGDRYVAVNIPNYTLDVIDNGQSTMHMKVVVGKMVERRYTPTFSASMTYLVLNPYWHVPKSIAENELFPLSEKDPSYFAKNNFVVHRVPIAEKQVPDPTATDGSTIAQTVYQYRLKQAPGPKNALGRVKFMFPNPHGVYLHDTPSKELFNRSIRTYSHGCIRIEKPLELAEYLLRGTEKWTRDEILATIARSKEKTIPLPEAIPVYIQYWTAWVDDAGDIQFRNDIYGYDDVPGARLPVSPPKNPRPQPMPAVRPHLQEAQAKHGESRSEPHAAPPTPQPTSPSSTLLEAAPP